MRKLLTYHCSGKCRKDGADSKMNMSQHHLLQGKDERRAGGSNLGAGKETLAAHSQQVQNRPC